MTKVGSESGALGAHGLGVASAGGWAGRGQKHQMVPRCPNPLDSSCCELGAPKHKGLGTQKNVASASGGPRDGI